MASEEDDNPISVHSACQRSGDSYVAVFDPLDGSRNIDASIPTGTIFGLYNSEKCMAPHFCIFGPHQNGAACTSPAHQAPGNILYELAEGMPKRFQQLVSLTVEAYSCSRCQEACTLTAVDGQYLLVSCGSKEFRPAFPGWSLCLPCRRRPIRCSATREQAYCGCLCTVLLGNHARGVLGQWCAWLHTRHHPGRVCTDSPKHQDPQSR